MHFVSYCFASCIESNYPRTRQHIYTQYSTMWSSTNRSKMMPPLLRRPRRLLTTQHYRQLAVIVTFAAFAMQTVTMADAQNSALTATTPKLVNGALATAATSLQLNNCSIVRSLFESQGINGADIPLQPITGKFCSLLFWSVHYFHSGVSRQSPCRIRFGFIWRNIPAFVHVYLFGRSFCRSVGLSLGVGWFFSNKMFFYF